MVVLQVAYDLLSECGLGLGLIGTAAFRSFAACFEAIEGASAEIDAVLLEVGEDAFRSGDDDMRHFGGIMVMGLLLCGFGGVGHAGQLPLYGGLARCTTPVVVPPGGAVYCVAMAESPEPIYVLLARILANKNKAVEQFGYSFGAAPGVVSVGYYAEEATNSFSPRSRYCQVVVGPASATLKATFLVRANGEVVFEQHESDLGPCPENNGRN